MNNHKQFMTRWIICAVISGLALCSMAFSKDTDDAVLSTMVLSSEHETEYLSDAEGRIYGIEDYSIFSDEITVLDTSRNEVLKVDKSAKKTRAISLDEYDIFGVKLATFDSRAYVLTNHHSVCAFENNEYLWECSLDNWVESMAIEDFYAESERLVICTHNLHEEKIETFYFIPDRDGIRYLSKKDGCELSNGMNAEINYDDKSGVVAFSDDSFMNMKNAVGGKITGLKYYGTDKNGQKRLLVKRVIQDHEQEYYVQSVLYLSKEGKINKELTIPLQMISSVNEIKLFDNKLYLLNKQSNKISIVNLDNTENLGNVEVDKELITWSSPAPEGTVRNVATPMAVATRQAIIDRAYSYYNFTWSCSATNVAPMANWIKPRYVGGAGTYGSMPYCWGGNDTVISFTNGINSGGKVGNIININPNPPSHVYNTYGMDCSGYVSRAWGRAEKFGTSTLPSISTQIGWADVNKGDIFNHIGHHVVLLIYRTSLGNYACYECTISSNYDRVVSQIKTQSSLSGYVPYKYNSLVD